MKPRAFYNKVTLQFFGTEGATILVDPRIPWQYSQGHIPGALSLPLESLFFDAWKLDNAGIIIVSG